MKHATVLGAAGVLLLSSSIAAGVALATPKMMTDAKKAGVPAANCQYCHSEKLPKKETFKPETLNDRGKFLMTDMKDRSLKEPDMSKLKEYKATK